MAGINAYGRVPTLMASQIRLNSLTRSSGELLTLNQQLSSGVRLARPSDDAVASAIVSGIDASIERDDQRLRNLSHARGLMNETDVSLSQITELVDQSKQIALEQTGSGSDSGTRAATSNVIGQHLTQLLATVNREFDEVHYFGGAKTGAPPIESYYGGYRYVGDQGGMFTDLGPEVDFPVTLSGDDAVGSLSTRVQGDVDLDPALTDAPVIRDLRGVMQGKQLGTLEIDIPTGAPTTVQVDLSSADTVGDLRDAIESAIRQSDATAFGAAAWGAGVTLAGDRLQFNLAAGVTLTFSDGPIGQTAQALGLDGPTYNNVTTSNPAPNAGLDPMVTSRTRLGDMTPAAALVYGDITIENGGRTGTVTTAAGMTVGELAEAIKRLDLGVRLEVHSNGDGLSLVNEVSGMRMSVSDAGTETATSLGIRTLTTRSDLSILNDGRGVTIADGEVDPITGLPDPDRNVDFEVVLSDGTTSFNVDLVPADLDDMASLLAKINAESGGAGGFTATLAADRNSIVFADTLGGAQAIEVNRLNGYAAEDLGLLDGTVGAGGELISEDRSGVRVDSLFSSLVELRDALASDDQRGISFAAQRLEDDLERVTETRAVLGTRAARVDDQEARLQDIRLADEAVRTELRDVDFAEAATRLNLLTTQLEAGYQVASLTQNLSLINFLR